MSLGARPGGAPRPGHTISTPALAGPASKCPSSGGGDDGIPHGGSGARDAVSSGDRQANLPAIQSATWPVVSKTAPSWVAPSTGTKSTGGCGL